METKRSYWEILKFLAYSGVPFREADNFARIVIGKGSIKQSVRLIVNTYHGFTKWEEETESTEINFDI